MWMQMLPETHRGQMSEIRSRRAVESAEKKLNSIKSGMQEQ